MKKLIQSATNTFNKMFGSKKKPAPIETIPVAVTSYSQPHVLQQHMRSEKMTHGQTVEANISPVRIEDAYGKKVMYFCPMHTMDILKKVAEGDGGCLPIQATVHNLAFPKEGKSGLYKLKNVQITSNGTLQVHATANTKWELV